MSCKYSSIPMRDRYFQEAFLCSPFVSLDNIGYVIGVLSQAPLVVFGSKFKASLMCPITCGWDRTKPSLLGRGDISTPNYVLIVPSSVNTKFLGPSVSEVMNSSMTNASLEIRM